MGDIVTVEEMIERIKNYLSHHIQKYPLDQDVHEYCKSIENI